MVDDETGLYGRINAINRLNLLSSPLLSFVLSSYALSVVTGHKRGFPEKLGKKNSVIALDGLDCLANCVGWKDTPSGLYFLCPRLRFAMSADLDGLVRAMSITVLYDKSFNDIFSLSPNR